MHIASIAAEVWATALMAVVEVIGAVLKVLQRIKAFAVIFMILAVTAGTMLCQKLAANILLQRRAWLKH